MFVSRERKISLFPLTKHIMHRLYLAETNVKGITITSEKSFKRRSSQFPIMNIMKNSFSSLGKEFQDLHKSGLEFEFSSQRSLLIFDND